MPDRGMPLDVITAMAEPLLGADAHVAEVKRLRGGSKKGVYRLRLVDGSTVIMYVWHPSENYWPVADHAGPEMEPFIDASSLELFKANHEALNAAGVRVPAVLAWPRPADDLRFVLVEDVAGGTLESLLASDTPAAAGSVEALGREIRRLHAQSGPSSGRAPDVGTGGGFAGRPEDAVFTRGINDLRSAAEQLPTLERVGDDVESALRQRRDAVTSRDEYKLIHGELGPDHVLLTTDLVPVLIDIEGVMFFDVEWEHVFLEIRFGPWYRRLAAPGLDEARLHLYRLGLYLSLVAGPLRLARTDFPEKDAMMRIADANLTRVLHSLQTSPP